jgi:hypothetical protein
MGLREDPREGDARVTTSPSPPTLPVRCIEASALLAAYVVRTDFLQTVTPNPLRVVELIPGYSALGIACIDYRQTTLGAYGEVGISWPTVNAARHPGLARIPALPLLFGALWPTLGWWVHKLPVTTEAARDAGVAVWGYPKFIASIDYSWDGAVRTCRLGEGGAEILRLDVDTSMWARPQQFTQRTYTRKDGQLLSTQIQFEGTGMSYFTPWRARLALGPHAMGEELKSWGLGHASAVNVQWFPVWRAVLPGPAAVP